MLFRKVVAGILGAGLVSALMWGCAAAPPKVRQEPPVPAAPAEEASGPQALPAVAGPEKAGEELIVPDLPGRAGKLTEEELPEEAYRSRGALAFVQQRLDFHEGQLVRWRDLDARLSAREAGEPRSERWPHCLAALEKTYSGYVHLRQRLTAPAGTLQTGLRIAEDDVLDAALQDIEYLASDCETVYNAARTTLDGPQNRTGISAGELESLIGNLAGQQDHAGVILTYRQLQVGYPEYRLAVPTVKAYILALMAENDEDGARKALAETVTRNEYDMNMWPLRQLYADLLLAEGDVKASRQQYQKLAVFFESLRVNDFWVADQLALLDIVNPGAPDFDGFGRFMKKFFAFDGRRIPEGAGPLIEGLERAYPESQLTIRARQIYRHMEEEVSSWVGRQLIAVDALVNAGEFAKAKALLSGLLQQETSPEVQAAVQRAMDEVVAAETSRQQPGEAGGPILSEQEKRWQEAERLLGMAQYDAALAIFNELLGTDYAERARVKIAEGAGKAAADLRGRAAELFVKARRTVDPEQKKDLMLQSWRLLKRIEQRYPETDLIDKVRKNRQDVEQQIRELDPLLLDAAPVDAIK